MAVFASKILTTAGWVVAILGPIFGLILMLASGQTGTSEMGPDEYIMLVLGGVLMVVGPLSGLFMVMVSSFVRSHLDSQTQLVTLLRAQGPGRAEREANRAKRRVEAKRKAEREARRSQPEG